MAGRMETKSGMRLGLMPTLLVSIAVLYLARDVLIPLVVAVLLAFILAPVVTWLEQRRVGRVAAVMISVGLAFAIVVTFGWTLERQFVDVAEKLPDYGVNIQKKLQWFQGAAGGTFSKAAGGVEDILKRVGGTQSATAPSIPSKLNTETQAADSHPGAPTLPMVSPQNPLPVREYSEPASPLQIIARYLGQLLSPLATGGLIVVFLVAMLLNRRDLRDRLIRLVGHGRVNVSTQALDDAATRISRYLLMQSVINLTFGICVGIGLWTIGHFSTEGHFPNVVLWALLAAVFRFVPYVGAFIGAAVPIVLSFAVFSGAGVFATTICMYLGIELVISQVAEPWLYGSRTGLSVMAILVSSVFWTWLWGPIGLLLATPLTVIVAVLAKYVPQLEFLDVVLGNEEVLEPSVRVYQRLLSLDQDEAGELLHLLRKEKGLEHVYDQVIVPALAMAETDLNAGTLDVEHGQFIRQAMRELIEELGDAQKADDAKAQDASRKVAEPDHDNSGSSIPKDPAAIVMCLPARDETDEIVGLMLVQLLEFSGQKSLAVSQASLAGEMLELIQAHDVGTVCISALPPGAISHARYLCKRLHARFPDLHTVVGLWTSKADPKTSLDRLQQEAPFYVVTSLGAAVAQIRERIQPLVLQRAVGDPAA